MSAGPSAPGRGQCGFSLIELAIVMVIIAALVSGAIIPLTTAIERARVSDAREMLDRRVRSALLGYAASRPPGGVHLPCPDCRATPCPGGTANDGIEDRNANLCSATQGNVTEGNLPWATLGLGDADPWGARYGYSVFEGFADSNGIALTTPSLLATGLTVRDSQGGNSLIGSPGTEGAAAVIWSAGKNRSGAVSVAGVAQPAPPPQNLDERENADADTEFVSRTIVADPDPDPTSAVQVFDDVLVWLSGLEVRGFLVQAARLP